LSRAWLLLVLLSGAACAGPRRADGAREVTVEAEGWAPTAGQNALSIRHRALAEAQKKAVETAVGVTVRARTKVENAVSIRESIEANMGGTIRRYAILSERRDGDFFKVRIRAVVLHRPGGGARRLKATRFSVKLPQERAASALRTTLSAHDFPLGQSEADSEVLISGVVETFGKSDLRLSGFHAHRAVVSLSVADTRTGIAEELTCSGAAMDLDDRAARDAALEEAGRSCGTELAAMYEARGRRVARAGPAPAWDGLE
jgi:hypothetical protein